MNSIMMEKYKEMVTQTVIQMAIIMEMDTQMELPAIGNLLEITKLGNFLKYSFETNEDTLCQQSNGISHFCKK